MSGSVFSICPHVVGFSPITASITPNVGVLQLDTESASLLILHESAEAVYHVEDRSIIAPAGSMLLLSAGKRFNAEITRSGSAILIGFITAEPSPTPSAMLLAHPTSAAKKAILHFIGAYQSKKEGWELSALADLYTALYGFARDSSVGNRLFLQNELIRPSVQYLEKHLCDRRLSIRAVAALSGVSETYFRTLFIRRFGVTPMQYVNRERIKRVEQLLANGTPHSDAIRLCGFSDRVSFLRAYERATGKAFVSCKS